MQYRAALTHRDVRRRPGQSRCRALSAPLDLSYAFCRSHRATQGLAARGSARIRHHVSDHRHGRAHNRACARRDSAESGQGSAGTRGRGRDAARAVGRIDRRRERGMKMLEQANEILRYLLGARFPPHPSLYVVYA